MNEPNTPQGTAGEPLSLEAIAADLQSMRDSQEVERNKYQEEIQKLREDNARLEGRLAGGGGGQPNFRFKDSETYSVAMAAAKQIAARLDPEDEQYQHIASNYQMLEQEYHAFNQQKQAEREELQNRTVSRAAFLARRGIDEGSEEAQIVELLHENDMPFERIEDMFLEPRTRVRELESGNASVQQTQERLSSANEIEEGVARTTQPAPISHQPLTGDDYARDDLVSRFNKLNPNVDELMFGQE